MQSPSRCRTGAWLLITASIIGGLLSALWIRMGSRRHIHCTTTVAAGHWDAASPRLQRSASPLGYEFRTTRDDIAARGARLDAETGQWRSVEAGRYDPPTAGIAGLRNLGSNFHALPCIAARNFHHDRPPGIAPEAGRTKICPEEPPCPPIAPVPPPMAATWPVPAACGAPPG